MNSSIDRLGVLLLEGVLEFNDYYMAEYEINADHIIIMGGRLIIGWPDDPFDGLVNIVLRGNASSPYYVAGGDGPTIGAKAIGKSAVDFLIFPANYDSCCLLSHLLICNDSLYFKQYGPRSDCSLGAV